MPKAAKATVIPTPHRIRVLVDSDSRVHHYCVTELLHTTNRSNVYKKFTHLELPEDQEFCTDSRLLRCAPTHRTLKAILAIPGVIAANKYDYELQVTIAGAFDWSECHDAIMATIQVHLFDGKTVVIECSPYAKGDLKMYFA